MRRLDKYHYRHLLLNYNIYEGLSEGSLKGIDGGPSNFPRCFVSLEWGWGGREGLAHKVVLNGCVSVATVNADKMFVSQDKISHDFSSFPFLSKSLSRLNMGY